MKKLAFLLAVALLLTFLYAGAVLATPGNYPPDTSSQFWNLGVYSRVYTVDGFLMLNPRVMDGVAPFRYNGIHPIVNANQTGAIPGDFNRAVPAIGTQPAQKVHTNFQLNTNSCASCHMTHTAPGDSLLFRAGGTYAVCASCHDGTGMRHLNVFEPSEIVVRRRNDIPQRSATDKSIFIQHRVSGTFGVDPSMNASVHLPTGDMRISSAPGGNRVLASETAGRTGSWTRPMDCASCHAPHGSYSYRLLHFNPNNIMGRNPADGGLRDIGLHVTQVVNAVYPTSPLRAHRAGEPLNHLPGPWLAGNDNAFFWIYNVSVPSVNLSVYFNIRYRNGEFGLKDGFVFDSVYVPAITNLRVDIARALVVSPPHTETTAAGTPFAGQVATAYGSQVGRRVVYQNGLNYNFFCAACHTDYMPELTERNQTTADAVYRTGIYSKAHRHKTFGPETRFGTMEVIADEGGQGRMICVSCHFVHGSDAWIKKQANEVVIGAAPGPSGDETRPSAEVMALRDVNPSSALKRYVNQSVCWKCHANVRASSFMNQAGYWDLVDQMNPGGFGIPW